MPRCWLCILWLISVFGAAAQPLTRANVASVLGFENGRADAPPPQWSAADTIVDGDVVHGGQFSARMRRGAGSASTFSSAAIVIPADFGGTTIEFRGFLKPENVSDSIAVWGRVDGSGGSLSFNTTQGLQVRGTGDWKEYSITLPVNREGRQVVLGFLLAGTGTVWADDFQLLVDGRPVAEAPARPPTVLETDRAFDAGSRVAVSALSELQVQNLATLARVWGFLKYHHPAVVTGQYHWDYELFRVMPGVLAAVSAEESQKAILEWLAKLPAVPECGSRCADLNPTQAYMLPERGWLSDTALLGPELSDFLSAVYAKRESRNSQFFIGLIPGVRNPLFENELTYSGLRTPDSGYQLLSLFRYWNIIQYFNPYRDVMSTETGYWNRVLEESIRPFATAPNLLAWQQELLKFITKINDTHASLWSSLAARPPVGACQLPVDVRFVEGKAYVIRINSRTPVESNLRPGDLILQLGGVPVEELIQQWSPYYAASNEPTRLRDIGNYMTRGACGSVPVSIDRGGETMTVSSTRVSPATLDLSLTNRHDRAGAAFQKLSDDVAYLKLGSVVAAQSASYIAQAAGTKGLIIDLRNYPSEFVVFTLGQYLLSEPREFARFTRGDLSTPGAFLWDAVVSLIPAAPRYLGKVVILVDEVTQSQAEYTTMAFRTATGAVVIGSTTAGADGNVSTVPLPGGMSSLYSGIGVFYPGTEPTQRIGILPDIEVKPTIAGMRAGRDELLDEAIRQITGK